MLQIQTPFIQRAFDYHEFDFLQKDLTQLTGQKVSYKEFNCKEKTTEAYRDYAAVFFLAGEEKQVDEMINLHGSQKE